MKRSEIGKETKRVNGLFDEWREEKRNWVVLEEIGDKRYIKMTLVLEEVVYIDLNEAKP